MADRPIPPSSVPHCRWFAISSPLGRNAVLTPLVASLPVTDGRQEGIARKEGRRQEGHRPQEDCTQEGRRRRPGCRRPGCCPCARQGPGQEGRRAQEGRQEGQHSPVPSVSFTDACSHPGPACAPLPCLLANPRMGRRVRSLPRSLRPRRPRSKASPFSEINGVPSTLHWCSSTPPQPAPARDGDCSTQSSVYLISIKIFRSTSARSARVSWSPLSLSSPCLFDCVSVPLIQLPPPFGLSPALDDFLVPSSHV